MGKRKPKVGSRNARKADRLRKQESRLKALETFVFSPADNLKKNRVLVDLCIPYQLPNVSVNNPTVLPLTSPIAVRPITGDGNCSFRALSYALTVSESYHQVIRAKVCAFMRDTPDAIRFILPSDSKGDVQLYLTSSQMQQNAIWGTEVEIMAAAVLFKANIFVYSRCGVHWKWIKNSPTNLDTQLNIYLYHKDGNHFEVVLAVENSVLPSSLSADQYYNPLQVNRDNYKKRKSESAKNSMKRKYMEDLSYQQKQKKIMTNKYSNDISFQTKVKKMAGIKYKEDPFFREVIKKRSKKKYELDAEFRDDFKQASKQKYALNSTFRADVKKASKQKYSLNSTFRADVETASKQKYALNSTFRADVKTASKQKYALNSTFRADVKTASKQKYALNSTFRADVKTASKQKYALNSTFRADVKTASKQKYALNSTFRADVKTASKQKYALNSTFRNDVKSASKQKYAVNVDFRQKTKNFSKIKYATNAFFREMVKKYSRHRYLHSAAYRKHVKAAFVLKYAQNVLFRKKLKDQQYKRYHENLSLRQKKKQQVELSRTLVSKSINLFRKKTMDVPKYVCRICIRILFRNQVKLFNMERYLKKKGQEINECVKNCITAPFTHVCSGHCPANCWMKILHKDKKWICHTCDRHMQLGRMPPQAQANNLFLSPVPSELSQLNVLERQLVSLRIPFMKLLSLPRGGQKGVKGPLVNIPSDLKSVTTASLNINEAQLIKVKLKRKVSYKGYYKFNWINPSSIINAIKYLKGNNIWYEDVSVNESWLSNNADNDLVQQEKESEHERAETDEETENVPSEEQDSSKQHDFPVESCFEPIDIGQEVLDTSETLCIAPAEKQTPQNIFQEHGSEAMAFPTLFPNGQFGMFERRDVKLPHGKYFNSRLFSADDRFSSNKEYIFFAQYVTELNRISSNISLALRKGRDTTDDGRKITATMVLNADNVQKILKSDVGFRFLQPVRGTPPYWQKTMYELYAMIHQIGIPTWFVTFSSAEMRWPEVISTLLYLKNDSRQPEDLEWAEKCSLIADNPVICARMFDHRVKALFADLLMSSSCPLGKVVDYFYRTEFQQRGSPHIHCLLWIKDAPKFGKDTDEKVYNFIDQHVSCKMPDKNSDPELFDIVSTVQVHSKSHSKTCRKYSSHCRFNFPRPPIQKTFIAKADSERSLDKVKRPPPSSAAEIDELTKSCAINPKKILNEIWTLVSSTEETQYSMSQILQLVGVTYEQYIHCLEDVATKNTVHMKRDLTDIWVINYNEYLSRAWNANLDIQFITDAYGCIGYVLTYISKAEAEMGDTLQNAQKEASEGNADAASALKQIGSAYMQNREVSAQEAVYRVCGLHLKECTRNVVFIPAGSNIFRRVYQ